MLELADLSDGIMDTIPVVNHGVTHLSKLAEGSSTAELPEVYRFDLHCIRTTKP
jgi:hypothetical protein